VLDVDIREPKPTGRFEFPHVRVYVDREWRLPVAADIWDADGIERGRYRYADVKFNVGLTDADFAPATYGLKPPKD
jgi:outer membrane lipoprotein-sorting protein